MKRYKVLSPHIGDKSYSIGDERLADPNEVRHLVETGNLEEIGDVSDPEEQIGATDEAAELRAEIATLVTDRADARARIDDLSLQLIGLGKDLEGTDTLRLEIETLTTDRDAARGQVDDLLSELNSVRQELEAEREKVKVLAANPEKAVIDDGGAAAAAVDKADGSAKKKG